MKKDGFTMIELVIVIALLGILAAIAIPGFIHWGPDIRLKAAARDLTSDMALAKLRAIRENANVVLTFNTGNNRYTIFVDNGAGGGVPKDYKLNGSEVVVKAVSMPSDVTMYEARFAWGLPRFRFNDRGLPNGLGGHVYMRNINKNYRGVSVSIVGLLQIQESNDGGSWKDVD
jgi:prepilin-type N-terminal cleavage/methylation domain-containing protein